jgi:hypothetical protein
MKTFMPPDAPYRSAAMIYREDLQDLQQDVHRVSPPDPRVGARRRALGRR